MLEGLQGQPLAQAIVHAAGPHCVEHLVVVGGIADHGYVLMVLGRGAQQGHAADVDLLDRIGQGYVRSSHGLRKGVEVADDEIDRRQAVRFQLGQVLRRAAGENAAVHGRVQRLDAAAQDLGEAGDVADVLHGQPGLPQRLRGAAAGDQLNLQVAQAACQIDQPGLVRYADQRSMDGHRSPLLPSGVKYCASASATPWL